MDARNLNGIITYAPISKEEIINYSNKNKKIFIAINSEKIMKSNEITKILINKNFGYPDGIGVVWALKRKGCNNVIKIPGCELWLDIIKSNYKSKSFYLIGGKEIVINKTVSQLENEFPGINILNHHHGYIKNDNQINDIIADVVKRKPDFVFVAMGSPKQEIIMDKMFQAYKTAYFGLGGSFDIYTGNKSRAPDWWLENNLEWCYRLLNEPKRIMRQIVILPFIIKLILNRL